MLMSDVLFDQQDLQWCELCQKHRDGHCDGCGNAFMARETRYRSHTFHVHPAAPGGIAGVRSVQKELCVDCYREDFRKACPGGEPPDLPDRGMDPGFHAALVEEKKRKRLEDIFQQAAVGPLSPEDVAALAEVSRIGLRFGANVPERKRAFRLNP